MRNVTSTDVQKPKQRTYRISTQISEYHGFRLESIHIILRHDCGKKRTLGELLELAIDTLESKYELSNGSTEVKPSD